MPQLIISPNSAPVRLGEKLTLIPKLGDAVASGGTWSVEGDPAGGSVIAGIYSAPLLMPQAGTVKIRYALSGQSADATITLLNPIPSIKQVSPETISSLNQNITLSVTGITTATTLKVNGSSTTFQQIDKDHIATTIQSSLAVSRSISIQLENPSPGAASSEVIYLPVTLPLPTVTPSAVDPGAVTFTVIFPTGAPKNPVAMLDGLPLSVSPKTTTTLTVSGYVPPWKTGALTLGVGDATSICNCMTIQVKAGAVPYDTASRFATQAAWGPRQDIVEHIQKIGLETWINEQIALPPDQYDVTDTAEQPRSHFLRSALNGQTLLRQRVAYGLQTFIPSGGYANFMTLLPWELKLESHAFGSYRQILLDAASTYGPSSMLNLPGNNVRPGSNDIPNQNFARELLQLFSIGSILLNEDGSPKLDAKGSQQFAYDAATIVNLSRALTGWQPVTWRDKGWNQLYAYGYSADFSADLYPNEAMHDNRPKSLFGTVLSASNSTNEDCEQAITAIFNHPNVPPFVSKLLIQRLVKSQPSPQYVYRISQVFKDDGFGKRGNLGAVVRAILLDPEARAGDQSEAGDQDGAIQTPLYSQLAMMGLLGLKSFDDSPVYVPANFGENWWYNSSVFGFFSPSYTIPGTSTISPEFQLLNTSTILARSQFIYGVVTGQQVHFPHGNYELYANFKSAPAMVDAMNHMLYHGRMPAQIRSSITDFSASQKTTLLQQQMAVAASLIDDNYLVLH